MSIQAQILNLLKELQRDKGLTYIFITHDLSVVNHFSDDIMVMYLGQVVEMAPAEELFANPMHPYTKALLSAILIPEVGANKDRIQLRGEITSPLDPPDECRFAKRCNDCSEPCRSGDAQTHRSRAEAFRGLSPAYGAKASPPRPPMIFTRFRSIRTTCFDDT